MLRDTELHSKFVELEALLSYRPNSHNERLASPVTDAERNAPQSVSVSGSWVGELQDLIATSGCGDSVRVNGKGVSTPVDNSAGGAGPRRAMAERSSPRAPRTGRTGAGGRAVPGPGPEGPPGSRAAAPQLLECHRCRYLRTGRACCQMVEALLAVLILVCSSVSYGSTGGYTGLPSLGGIYYYQYGGAYSGFSGADGEKAQQLDQHFCLLKLPIARAAMAVGGCLLVFPCVLILVGVVRLPWHFPVWLLLECILDIVIATGIVPALYYFFHFLLGVYNSSVCKEREQLYQSKGYQDFRCSLHGAEIAAGLSGCIAVLAYLLSAGLAVRGYRTVHKLKQKPVQLYEL
ncbi:MARVEL domain-containing protein 3 [Calonectris borealis]|uniref:MARVEL domain-containing protein 3 n=1 Tax=Calonectris borealis TaxID=1323832 RepID=UPI003F4B5807